MGKIILLIPIIMLWAVLGVQAQGELVPVVECLGAPAHEFDNWQNVRGVSIWPGYENDGYKIPSDWYFLPDEIFYTSVGTRYMWIVGIRSMQGTIYVFSFISMEPYADANGEHYGVHPCGIYQVTAYPIGLIDARTE